MALVDSLLTAMVRANGDALVMHVGERPMVVAGARMIDLSQQDLNLGAMVGMLGQLLPPDAQASLQEFGAVEHRLPDRENDRFSVVAARGGDDIWIEIRRRPNGVPVAAAVAEPEPMVPTEPGSRAAVILNGAVAGDPVIQAGTGAEPVLRAGTDAEPVTRSETEAEPARQAGNAAEPVLHAGIDVQNGAEAAAPVSEAAAAAPTSEAEAQADAGRALDAEAQTAALVTDPEAQAADPEVQDTTVPPATDDVAAVRTAPVDAGPQEATRAHAEAEGEADHAAVVAQETQATPAVAEIPLVVEAPALAPAMASAGNGVPAPAPSVPPAPPPLMAVPISSAAVPAAVPISSAAAAGSGEPPPVPVTRTVRIEVPSRAVAPRMGHADRLLRAASTLNASELFLMSQARPCIRVERDIRVLSDEPPLLPGDIEAMLADLTPEPWRDAVRRGEPAEWLIEIADAGRVRCASFRDHRGPGAIFHFTSTHAASAEQLQLDAAAQQLATEPDGLVLVAGFAGSDKSAIVAAFVDTINRLRSDYVITIEPQVRVQHENRRALVSQREVGAETERAVTAARAALRENPDVLVLEDVASGELVGMALEAANDGRLVVVSMEAGSTVEAVHRLIDLVPVERRAAARIALAQSFRGGVAQLLLRKVSGGRVAARELLTATSAVSRAIADGTVADLWSALEAERGTETVPLVDALVRHVQSGTVDAREAFRKAPDRARLLAGLRAAGVETSALDRLA